MRTRKLGAAVASAVLMFGLAACVDNAGAGKSTLAKVRETGKLVVGVKADQPGVGVRNPETGGYEGFDVEMAKVIAAAIGVDPGKIEFKETVSENREPFIQKGTVDIVIASYSITDERRGVVGQAGPYYVTGQQLLVREEDKGRITGPDQLKGVKVCSVAGSTSIKRATDQGAQPVPFGTYTECVQQLLSESVDVVTTDGAILLGYAALQPDKLEVVGAPFSEERYGVGFKKGDTEFCDLLRKAIQDSFQDGTWKTAFESTLGKSGAPLPTPPQVDSTC